MKIVNIDGVKYRIFPSSKKRKKFMVNVRGQRIHFGEKGYRIKPGTNAGDRYCARSFGLSNDPNNIMSANYWSRVMWKCAGKKTKR